MGQAAVDLPDPMQPPVSAAGTDELLAQLAGEEIDRLLAEADAERPAEQKAGAALPAAQAPSMPQESVPPAVQQQAAQAAAAADAELSSELDNLFAELTINQSAPPAAAPQAAAPATIAPVPNETPAPSAEAQSAAPPAPVAEAAPIHPVEEELRATEAMERAGRAAAAAEAQGQPQSQTESPPPAKQDAALAMLASESAAPLPLFLRPLEWLSAPLDAFPEGVRDVIGKVAILTAVNAISVIVYVLAFRRH